jgi:hypothetical protein
VKRDGFGSVVRGSDLVIRTTPLLSATMALGMLACTSEETLTQPETAGINP